MNMVSKAFMNTMSVYTLGFSYENTLSDELSSLLRLSFTEISRLRSVSGLYTIR